MTVCTKGHALGTEVVIVDDEVEVAQEIADGLTDEGYACTVARTAEEVLRLVDDAPGRFTVVVTDIRMPGMNGMVLAGRLLHPDRTIQPGIVMITGHAVPEEIATAFPAGLVHVVRKPFRWEEFIAGVRLAESSFVGSCDA